MAKFTDRNNNSQRNDQNVNTNVNDAATEPIQPVEGATERVEIVEETTAMPQGPRTPNGNPDVFADQTAQGAPYATQAPGAQPTGQMPYGAAAPQGAAQQSPFTQPGMAANEAAAPTGKGGKNDGTVRVHDKLSNKMLGFVIGISLACGLGAGIAGTAITNAITHNSGTTHSRTMNFGEGEMGEMDQFGPMGGSQDSEGTDGEGMEQQFQGMGRGGMKGYGQRGQQAPDANSDGSGSNSDSDKGSNSDKDSSNSDSDKDSSSSDGNTSSSFFLLS
ncbi:MAG: hypothetical protein UHD09_01215 [Bifidobacterium sp.]|nr:hypothetical protein [Bifidobacterium sp.]